MFFSIDTSNGVPIYDQIVRQIKFAVAQGTLRPGQMLPSVRALAQQLTINPNTIARAFQQLQSDQIVEPLRGRGLVVVAEAKASCVQARRDLITTRLRAVLCEAMHSGLTEKQILDLVSRQVKDLSGKVSTVASTELDDDASNFSSKSSDN